MTSLVVTMLVGWFLGTFGWMAIAAIAAAVLAYAFKGRKAAAVTAVLAVAVLLGWSHLAGGGFSPSLGAGRQLTAQQRLDARRAQQRKQWQSWNKGAEELVNNAAAQLTAQVNAMAGPGGGMSLPMPNVQVPNIRLPSAGPAHSGPLFGGAPGHVTVSASHVAPVAPAARSAAPVAAMGNVPLRSVPSANTGPDASGLALAALDAAKELAKSTPAGSQGGQPSGDPASPPKTSPPTGGMGGGQTTLQKSKAATSPASAAEKRPVPGKAGTPVKATAAEPPARRSPAGSTQASQGRQPAVATAAREAARTPRPSPPGGNPQRAAAPRRYRPHYQPTGEDAVAGYGTAGRHAAQGQNGSGTVHPGGAQSHPAQHRPRYQNTEQYVNPYMAGMHGNAAAGGMDHASMAGHSMGVGQGQMASHPLAGMGGGMSPMGAHPFGGMGGMGQGQMVPHPFGAMGDMSYGQPLPHAFGGMGGMGQGQMAPHPLGSMGGMGGMDIPPMGGHPLDAMGGMLHGQMGGHPLGGMGGAMAPMGAMHGGHR